MGVRLSDLKSDILATSDADMRVLLGEVTHELKGELHAEVDEKLESTGAIFY